jgi:hypothetical protein
MNRKLNTKWLGVERTEKERKLFSKVGAKNKSKLEAFLNQASKIRNEIKTLQGNNSASIKLNIIAQQIVNNAEDKDRVDKILKKLDPEVPGGPANLKKWDDFQQEYLAGDNGIYKLSGDLKNDNYYPIKWENKIYDSNESLGAERISYELVHQLSKIEIDKIVIEAKKIIDKGDKTNATVKDKEEKVRLDKFIDWLGKASGEMNTADNSTKTNQQKIDERVKEFQGWSKNMSTVFYGREKYDEDGKGIDKPWSFEYRDFSDKKNNFDFAKLDEFVAFLAPQREDGIIDFINEFMPKIWGDNQKWRIWTASPLTEAQKKEYAKDKKVPQYYANKGKVIYWGNERGEGDGRNNITLKGLRGWVELYRAIFNNSTNRKKFEASQIYIKRFSELYRNLIYKGADFDNNINLEDTTNADIVKIKTFHDDFGITFEEVYDENGNAFYLPLTYEVGSVRRDLKGQQAKLEAIGDSLGKNDMANQGKLENDQNALVYGKYDELEKLDVKINDLMTKDEVKEKIQKLNELKKTLKATTDNKLNWGKKDTILIAAKVHKLLLDIAWLQNDGIEGSKTLKEDKNAGITRKDVTDNLDLIHEIEQQRNILADAWDVEIRGEFDKKGSTAEERIKKTKEESGNGGIGLEAVRDALRRLNRGDDSKAADKIDEELKKGFVASDSKDLTTTELNSALGISDSTEDMVIAWGKLANGWGKLEANIKTLFSSYSDKDKKTALITYIKDKLESINNDIKAASSDEDKFVAFKKQSPEFIIEHLVRHENSKALKDVKSEEGKAVIERMKKVEDLDTKTYGDPKKPKTIDSEKLYTFLRDEKIDNINKLTSQDKKEETKGSAIINHAKAHYGWYIGGVLLFIIGVVAIFWKNILEWWNGPAEEGEVEKQEDDNE